MPQYVQSVAWMTAFQGWSGKRRGTTLFQLRCTNLLAQPVAGWLMYAAGGIICITTLLTIPSYSLIFLYSFTAAVC